MLHGTRHKYRTHHWQLTHHVSRTICISQARFSSNHTSSYSCTPDVSRVRRDFMGPRARHTRVIHVSFIPLTPYSDVSSATRHFKRHTGTIPQWFRKAKNRDVSTAPLACPFACIARIAHSFACSTRLASLARSAALIHSLARSLTLEKLFSVLNQGAPVLCANSSVVQEHTHQTRIIHTSHTRNSGVAKKNLTLTSHARCFF